MNCRRVCGGEDERLSRCGVSGGRDGFVCSSNDARQGLDSDAYCMRIRFASGGGGGYGAGVFCMGIDEGGVGRRCWTHKNSLALTMNQRRW
jgi:hypothetical protein